MKRLLVALVVGVAVFGSVMAFAATLTVNTKTLGSGSNAVASCNASATLGNYNTIYSAALPGYKVTTVAITSAAGCATMSYRVTLTGAANASLGEVTGSLDATGAATPDFTAANVAASAVTGVQLDITG